MELSGRHCGEENSQCFNMQRKRNILLMFSLLALVSLTLVLFFVIKDLDGNIDKSIFSVTDFNALDKIILTRDDKIVELKFEGNRWKVNNQLADRRMIDVLFATLQQAEPKRAVAKSLKDSINRMLNERGVEVRLFEGESMKREFIAGGNQARMQSYFKSSETGESFIMVIPGYRVYTSGIFELDENGWKDKYVFNFNWRNFQQLTSTIPDSPKNNFEVAMGKSYFEITGMPNADTTKLNNFLDAISLLTVDQYVNKDEVKGYDSIIKLRPILELFVTDVSGKRYSLLLYDFHNKAQILGIIQNAQLAYFDKKRILEILKSKNWFMPN